MAIQVRRVDVFTTAFGITARLIRLQFQLIAFTWFVVQLHAKDAFYTVVALLFPYRPVGHVIQKGDPGFAGIWPRFSPPTQDDSRSPCPGLNALANHGILPRDGKRVGYKQMSEAIQKAYNICPSLGDQLTASAFLIDQGRGYIDLSDLNALGIVQHDASFTRHDIAYVSNQAEPDADLVTRFIQHATDKKNNRPRFSLADMSYYNGLRRAECKASNTQYSLSYSFFHKFFGSGNAAMLYSLFDGDAEDLDVFLHEERFPDGWEPKVRWYGGHTIIFAQIATFMIEFNTWERQQLRPGDSFFNQMEKLKLKKPW
ncbi:hypothetical protein FRC04_001522 [Tulasnella sp. 424]|nr:hypothetical protein FRC04_001522 [Tulasnella sp. 424]KAG8969068.1 hypothetical protein FRC05_001221 [Tulasnella sp. 425]